MRWRDLAAKAGVSEETIRQIRIGGRDGAERYTASETKLETALGWQAGSIDAIRHGGTPTPLTQDDLEERILADERLNEADKKTLLHLYRTLRDKDQ